MNGKSRISETNITQAALIRDSLSLSLILPLPVLMYLSLCSFSPFLPFHSFHYLFFFPHFSPNLSLETG